MIYDITSCDTCVINFLENVLLWYENKHENTVFLKTKQKKKSKEIFKKLIYITNTVILFIILTLCEL